MRFTSQLHADALCSDQDLLNAEIKTKIKQPNKPTALTPKSIRHIFFFLRLSMSEYDQGLIQVTPNSLSQRGNSFSKFFFFF